MERKDDSILLNQLMAGLQQEAGEGFQIEHVLDLSPVMSEVKVFDQASKRHFCARIYRSGEHSEFLKKAWALSDSSLKSQPRKLPQPSYGIKAMGNLLAHIGAFIPGMHLGAYLSHLEICSEAYTVRLAIHLVKTLQLLESQKCEHHNITPSNIVISKEGRIHLKNAGLYHFEKSVSTKMGLFELEDIRYAAPEVIQGQEPTVLSDIYQVGLILFEMVAGMPPFNGSYDAVKEGHLQKPAPNPQTFNPSVGVGLVRVLARALAKNPEQRFRNLAEFRQALEFLLPAVERYAQVPRQDANGDPKEETRIKEQLNEARNMAGHKQFDDAMRMLDSLIMVSGPRNDAITLYRKIWQAKNAGEIQKGLENAEAAMARDAHLEALKAIHGVLSLQSNHPQALAIQGQVFENIEGFLVRGSAAIPLDRYNKEAEKAMASGNIGLAEGLLTQVMIVPIGDDPQNTLTLRGQKQSAVKALTQIRESRIPKPAVQGPPTEEMPTPTLPKIEQSQTSETDHFEEMDMENLFQDPETTENNLPKLEIPEVPKPPLPVTSSPSEEAFDEEEDLLGLPEEEEEDLLGLPPEAPVKPAQKKGVPKAAIFGGAALVALLLIAVVVMFVVRGQTRKKAMEAYQAANALEESGKWSAALESWGRLNRAFPDFNFPDASGAERYKILEIKIKQKNESIEQNINRAREILADAQTPIHEMEDGPVHYVKKVLELDPNHQEALGMMASIQTRLSEMAWALWDDKDILGARDAYRFMVSIDKAYVDETLENNINEWVRINVVEPQLKGLDAAIKRKNWEKAFQLTEELEETLEDPLPVRDRWNEVYAGYEANFLKAEEDGNSSKMLEALEVMVQIRPEDKAMLEKKDRLSRTLNLSRIQGLEKEVKAAMDRNQLQKAGNAAMRLRALESENEIAKNTLYKVRTTYEGQITELKNGNPRSALPVYDTLIKMLNWKTHKTGKKELSARITEFDRQYARLKKQKVMSFGEYKASLDQVISDFSDFSNDEKHNWLVSARDDLLSQNQRFQALLRWEEKAREDVSQPYADILSRLSQEKPFRFDYARQKVAQIIDYYKNMVSNYKGNVTLVIKAAKNLPQGKGAFSRDPKAYCQLNAAGRTFKTDVAGSSRSPMWNFACNFSGGGPLVFNVYNKKGNALIGVVELDRIPKNGKNMVFKPKTGDWQLLIDIKRER